MNGFFSWIKLISGTLVVLSLFRNLLPNDKYDKYLSVFLGMLVVFVVFEPLGSFGLINNIEDLFETNFFSLLAEADPIYESEAAEAFSYRLTAEEYEWVVKTQIAQFAESKGYSVNEVEVELEQENGDQYGCIRNIRVVLSDAEADSIDRIQIDPIRISGEEVQLPAEFQELRNEIAVQLGISENVVIIETR